ncbi:MAG: hypothetical protein WC538_14970 [Thermoanaerobaculia bacterium]|jgi:hypothetical protein
MKNSQKILIGFAIVAVAIIAIVAVKYPPVESPDAQGSIGAVQKFRDEQIKPADVVLGDEQSRRVESALYGSLLEQAAGLQSFSADLASFSRGLENRDQIEAFSTALASREDALGKSALMAAADLQSKDQLASFKNDLQSISKGFENRSNLGVKELQSFETSLANMQQDLQAKEVLASKNLVEAQSRLDSIQKLGSKADSLESMKADLASISDALASRDQMESKVLEAKMLGNRVDQLGVRVLEQKSLLGVKQDLAAIEKDLGNKADLASRADALGSKAAEFLGLSTRLESRALGNMSSRLESRNLESKSLLGLKEMIGSVSKGLESRQGLESKSLGSMQQELACFEKTLGSREADLNQKFSLGMKSELAAINNHLDNRENLSAKFDLASKSDLAAKSGLGSKDNLASKDNLGSQSDLASKSGLSNRDSLGAFNNYLGSLSKTLESKSGLASRENDLGAKTQELQNRAADLQSKSNF